MQMYNMHKLCSIILCFGLSSSEYHFVSQKSGKIIQKLISNQNNSEYEMSDSDRSF